MCEPIYLLTEHDINLEVNKNLFYFVFDNKREDKKISKETYFSGKEIFSIYLCDSLVYDSLLKSL